MMGGVVGAERGQGGRGGVTSRAAIQASPVRGLPVSPATRSRNCALLPGFQYADVSAAPTAGLSTMGPLARKCARVWCTLISART